MKKGTTREEVLTFELPPDPAPQLFLRKIKIYRPSDHPSPVSAAPTSCASSSSSFAELVAAEAQAKVVVSEDLLRESQLSMSAAQILENYFLQEAARRQGILSSLPELVKSLSAGELKTTLLPIVRSMPLEVQKNKSLFLSRVHKIAKILSHEGPKNCLFEPFMETLQFGLECLFEDPEEEIRKVACKTVTKLTPILKTEEQRGEWMLTLILKLGHEADNENSRKSAIQLLNQLAPLFGTDLAESFIINELHGLSDDPAPGVRNVIPANLDRIAKVVSPLCFVNKLLDSVIHKLSNDKAWTVRRSVADEIANLNAAAPSADVRKDKIYPLYEKLSRDPQKWVRTAILRQLGKFISSFPSDESKSVNSQTLLKQFLGIPAQCSNNTEADKQIVYQCAYTFPAVLYSFGEAAWDTSDQDASGKALTAPVASLGALHKRLLGMRRNLKIQKTLAASLHEVAKILGPERAEREILPLALSFLSDSSNKGVRKLVFRYLPQLAAALPERARQQCLQPIQQIYSSTGGLDWRIRAVIAEQVEVYSQYFAPDIVESAIADILMQALFDTVASVRKAAARSTGMVLLQCLQGGEGESMISTRDTQASEEEEAKPESNPFEEAKDSHLKRGFPKFLLATAAHPSHTGRCVFVDICESIGRVLAESNPAKLREQWENNFKMQLLDLASDRCYDVRLRLVRMLAAFGKGGGEKHPRLARVLLSESELEALLKKLVDDQGREIRVMALQIGGNNGRDH